MRLYELTETNMSELIKGEWNFVCDDTTGERNLTFTEIDGRKYINNNLELIPDKYLKEVRSKKEESEIISEQSAIFNECIQDIIGYLIKPEQDNLLIIPVYSTNAHDCYAVSNFVTYIHEDIFMYDTSFAKYSLSNINLKDFIVDIYEHEGKMVTNLLDYGEDYLKSLYANYSELKKLVYDITLEKLPEEIANYNKGFKFILSSDIDDIEEQL